MRRLLSSLWGGSERPEPRRSGRIPLPQSIRPDPVLWLILCGGLLVTAIILGTAVMVGEFRERALSNSERELENTVRCSPAISTSNLKTPFSLQTT